MALPRLRARANTPILSQEPQNVRNHTKIGQETPIPPPSIKMQKIYFHGLGCRGSACSLQNATVISRCANAQKESEQFSLSKRMYSVLQLVP
jgi:hypothetical protein